MLIIVNGAEKTVADGSLLIDLLPRNRRGTAVAVNDTIVPRHLIDERTLAVGDRIEIVTAVQGG